MTPTPSYIRPDPAGLSRPGGGSAPSPEGEGNDLAPRRDETTERARATRVSIVVPALNESLAIEAALAAARPLRAAGHEIIVADGGSADDTRAKAAPLCDLVVEAPRGRASQMNAGAARASGDILLFLHADTRLPPDAARLVVEGLARSGKAWGRFDVRVEGEPFMLRVIGRMMNLRSRLTGVATGDQAIFVRADVFRATGGFPDLPLMEDIAFSTAMKKRGAPLCLSARVATSGRRWEKHGVWRTILLMWRLRAAFFLGADPRRLAERYGYAPRKS